MKKLEVIVVTDGDSIARKAVEMSARTLGLRTISASGGNPTPISGQDIAELVRQAASYPVIVMFDDKGEGGVGVGEKALSEFSKVSDMKIIGALAVASNCPQPDTVDIISSVTQHGELVEVGVDKLGYAHSDYGGSRIFGDTVGVLKELNVPILGVGDIGKMNGNDGLAKGAPVTTKALYEILRINGLA